MSLCVSDLILKKKMCSKTRQSSEESNKYDQLPLLVRLRELQNRQGLYQDRVLQSEREAT